MEKVNTFFRNGAMFAIVEDKNLIVSEPVQLGDQTLVPGDYVKKIGKKKRSSFKMKEGYYLKYVGRIDKLLLFTTNVNEDQELNIYYAFHYITPKVLLIGSHRGCMDIIVDHIEIHKEVEKVYTAEQLTLF